MTRPRRLFRHLAGTTGRAVGTTVLAAALMVAPGFATSAFAHWTAGGAGSTTTTTAILPGPSAVTVPETAAGDVPVEWTAGVGTPEAEGFFVTRIGDTSSEPACGTDPTTLITAESCVDVDVPDGSYTYVVTAVYRSWTAPSTPSAPVTTDNPDGIDAAGAPADEVAAR